MTKLEKVNLDVLAAMPAGDRALLEQVPKEFHTILIQDYLCTGRLNHAICLRQIEKAKSKAS